MDTLLDDIDAMDDELFTSSLRRSSKSTRSIKKTSFEDFDEDDPLGDLLSSNSESSRGTPSPRERRTDSVSSGNSALKDKKPTSKSKVIANLFGLDEPEQLSGKTTNVASNVQISQKSPIKKPDPGDWLGLKLDTETNRTYSKSDTNPQVERKLNPVPRKSMPPEDNDLLADLGIDDAPRESGTSKGQRTGVSGELLRKSTNRGNTTSTMSEAKNEPKKTESVLASFMNDFDDKPASAVTSDSGGIVVRGAYTPSASREPRRSTGRRTGNLADPLGLFSSSYSDSIEPQLAEQPPEKKEAVNRSLSKVSLTAPATENTNATAHLPPWLGGNSSNPTVTSVTPAPPVCEASTSVSATSFTSNTAIPVVTSSHHVSSAEQGPDATLYDNAATILDGLTNVEQQVSAAAAEQQKSIITALALKRQEDMLLTLQAQQSAMLRQHEQQLGAIVQRQIQRQQQLIQQQQQIQSHIETIMSQPYSTSPLVIPPTLLKYSSTPDEPEKVISHMERHKQEEEAEKVSELLGRIQRVELEKSELEYQLDTERRRYEERLSSLEDSYKRQLAANEEAMLKQERRFIMEKEELEKEASIRITRLKEEHNEATRQQAERMAALHTEWLSDLQRLGEFHRQAVEMLRSEQTSAVEHWNAVQAAEMAAIKDAHSSARLLEAAVARLETSAVAVQHMQRHLNQQEEKQLHEKKEQLHTQESVLNGMKEALEQQLSALEAERNRLAALSHDLEARVLHHQKECEAERHRCAVREEEWAREKRSAIEILEKDRQRLEKLQAEAQADVAQLAAQKLELAADVARLDATIRLQGASASKRTQDVEKMEAEARATLQAAVESKNEVEREREQVSALQRRLITEQQQLAAREKDLRARELQVQSETQKAAAARAEGISALQEARRLESERTEHASDLAKRLLHLKERENQLTKEKVALSREWKRIQETRDSIVCSQCGQLPSLSLNSSRDVIDPLPLIIKLEAEQGLEYSTLDRVNFHSSLLDIVSQ